MSLRDDLEIRVLRTMPHGNLDMAELRRVASEVVDEMLDLLTERADEWPMRTHMSLYSANVSRLAIAHMLAVLRGDEAVKREDR